MQLTFNAQVAGQIEVLGWNLRVPPTRVVKPVM
jgi:hypothetical protein